VGTRERVRIKKDRWLRDKANGFVISPLSQVVAEASVISLIDQEKFNWKERWCRIYSFPMKPNNSRHSLEFTMTP